MSLVAISRLDIGGYEGQLRRELFVEQYYTTKITIESLNMYTCDVEKQHYVMQH